MPKQVGWAVDPQVWNGEIQIHPKNLGVFHVFPSVSGNYISNWEISQVIHRHNHNFGCENWDLIKSSTNPSALSAFTRRVLPASSPPTCWVRFSSPLQLVEKGENGGTWSQSNSQGRHFLKTQKHETSKEKSLFRHEQALLGPSWYPCIVFSLSLRNMQRHSTLAVAKLGLKSQSTQFKTLSIRIPNKKV